MKITTGSRVPHLPVVEGQKVVGIVSIGDLVNWIISAQADTIHQLHSYIHRKVPRLKAQENYLPASPLGLALRLDQSAAARLPSTPCTAKR